ncbi:MAG: protein translocase subunit SecF, partial [Chromatocurvus sp.]
MKQINFMGQRRVAVVMSAVLLLISLGSLIMNQLEWGLDFTGGTLVEVQYGDSADLNAIRSTLETAGYEGAIVVSFGTDRDVLIRLPADLDADANVVLQTLRDSTGDSVELQRTEFVGPQV